jgi:hypothetical protein
MKPNSLFLSLCLSTVLFDGCSGKTLDVGTAHQSATSTDPEQDAAAPVDVGAIAGVWVMTRQDGEPGLADPKGPSPMELELSSSGVAYRSECARPAGEVATTACPPASTHGCISGTVKREGDRWRIDLPAIRVGGAPEQGETLLMTDGTLFVSYINPSYSAGYFRRIGTKDETGGCPR